MIFDGTVKFSESQAISATANSTNTWDRGAKSGRLFNPRMRFVAQVVGAGAGTGTIQAKIQVSANNSDWTDKYTGLAVTGANAVAGHLLIDGIPALMDTDERYVRINYTVTGTVSTAPKVTAFIALDGTPYPYTDVTQE